MNTYTRTSNLLQIISIWIILSSCFKCCWERNCTDQNPLHHELQLPEIETSLQEYTMSAYSMPTISDQLIEAASQYYSIIKQYAEFIQLCTSATSILHLESQLEILRSIHESLSSSLLQAGYPEIMEILDKKLQTVQSIQTQQQAIISACTEQLKKSLTQPTSPEENLFLQAQQELCTKISSLCNQLIKNMEEAKNSNMVVVN